MDFETSFSVTMDPRSYDESVFALAEELAYEAVERNRIGEALGTTGRRFWTENRLVFAARPDVTATVESVVEEAVDRAAALPAPVHTTFTTCRAWLIVRLLDRKFVDLHDNRNFVAKLAVVGLVVYAKNRSQGGRYSPQAGLHGRFRKYLWTLDNAVVSCQGN